MSYQDSYPDTKPKFAVGDEVIVGPVHRWNNQVYTGELTEGTICVILETDPGYDVGYTFATHTYHVRIVGNADPKKGAESHVDEDCLEFNYKPVTKKELTEVYKILGVSK